MEVICLAFDGNITQQPILRTHPNLSESNLTGNNSAYTWGDTHDLTLQVDGPTWGFVLILTRIIIPSLCIFGVVGNLLNLFILLRRVRVYWDILKKCDGPDVTYHKLSNKWEDTRANNSAYIIEEVATFWRLLTKWNVILVRRGRSAIGHNCPILDVRRSRWDMMSWPGRIISNFQDGVWYVQSRTSGIGHLPVCPIVLLPLCILATTLKMCDQLTNIWPTHDNGWPWPWPSLD